MHATRLVPLLQVESVARSLKFYQDAFGVEVTAQWPDEGTTLWAHFKIDEVEFMLGTPQELALADRTQTALFGDGAVYYLTVGDADAVHAELKAKGYEVTDPCDQFYGFREFYIRDPDGNQFAIGHGIPPSDAPK